MARSMTITQEDDARPSMLFLGFFALAAGWMLLGAWTLSSADAAEVDVVPADNAHMLK